MFVFQKYLIFKSPKLVTHLCRDKMETILNGFFFKCDFSIHQLLLNSEGLLHNIISIIEIHHS